MFIDVFTSINIACVFIVYFRQVFSEKINKKAYLEVLSGYQLEVFLNQKRILFNTENIQ